jgi:hypothetical protein
LLEFRATSQQNFQINPLGFLRAGFFGAKDRDAYLRQSIFSAANYSFFNFVGALVVVVTNIGSGLWNYATAQPQVMLIKTDIGGGTWLLS